MSEFGYAKLYYDVVTNEQIKFRKDKNPIGTAKYVSINTHKGYQQSRRDDLESLCYLLVFFLTGTLPWHDYEHMKKDKAIQYIQE